MSAAMKKPQQRANATEASHKRSTQATVETVTFAEPVVESLGDEAIVRAGEVELLFRTEGSEPLVRDEDYARWLGFSRPRDIRALIKTMISAKKLNDVAVRGLAPQTTGGRPGREFWLTRTQALLVATQSDTPRAWAMTETIVRVFDAVTRRPEAQELLTRAMLEREFMTGESRAKELSRLAKLAGSIGKHFSDSTEDRLTALALEIAKGAACYGGVGRDLASTSMDQFQTMRSALYGVARWGVLLSKKPKRLPRGRRINDGQIDLPLTATFELPSATVTVTVEPRESV